MASGFDRVRGGKESCAVIGGDDRERGKMARVVKEGRWYECSNCGGGLYVEGEPEPDWIDGYCPYCGEKFEEATPYNDLGAYFRESQEEELELIKRGIVQ